MKKKQKDRKLTFTGSVCKVLLGLSLGLMLVLTSAFQLSANALQGGSLTGVVLSATDNSPIVGATVVVKGTTVGTTTNIDGEFSLEAPMGSVLVVSFIGFESTEVQVQDQRKVTISLKEGITDLDEVMVIGYGVQKKKLNTGATTQVTGEDLQRLNTVSPLGALQSQTPGVSIIQNSGMPGEGFKVSVRGLGTVGNSSPLYVIDGVAGGDINNLNPADIESVDVLKDAASAAIYGSRAANGVILVTTKQGKAGKIQTSYDGFFGIQNPWKVAPLLNAKEYMTILDEVNFNEGLAPYNWETMMPGLYKKVQEGWEGTNWLNEIRNVNAPTQNHAINIIGGNDISKFSLGFSYTAQEGIYGAPVMPNYDRYTFRINSEHVLVRANNMDVIKVGENVNFNFNQRNGIGIGNLYWNDIHNMLVAPPLMPVLNEEGEYFNKKDKDSSGLSTLNPGFSNPIADMVYKRGYNKSKNYGLTANAYVDIQPVKNLIFRSSFGYRMSANSYRSYLPDFKDLSNDNISTGNVVSQSMGSGYHISWDNTLSYMFNVGEHNFSTVLGQSIEKMGMGESMNAENGPSIFSDFEHAWLDNTKGLTAGKTKFGGEPWGAEQLASFFGRVLYNYKETYMASVVLRADGSSKFARGNRWGYYPSVSAGWVMTNEPFMSGVSDYMDFFKLRGSWGQNGNNAIESFQYLATIAFDNRNSYTFGNDRTQQSTGAYADILPNKDIAWETSEQINIGFDARFLKSRLGVAFDMYQKSTYDWLVDAPILASYGTGAPFINGGDVQNRGIELAFSWNDRAGDFTYGINLNGAFNQNEVIRLANSEGIIHGEPNVLSQGTTEMYRVEVGYPIGYFWGYKTDGVFQNLEQIANTKVTLQENPQPGDLIFVDYDGDGEINEKDKTMIGSPKPKLNMGFSFNLAYKGFDFMVATNGAFGHQIAKSYRSFADSKIQNYTADIFDRWHGEGTSDRLPRLTSGSNANWQEISDIYVEDGDYLRIQNVTLGYDFKKLFPKMPLGQARLYVAAQNLYTFTKYSGMDPEIGYGYDESWVSGIDLGFFPSPRTYLVGVNIKF